MSAFHIVPLKTFVIERQAPMAKALRSFLNENPMMRFAREGPSVRVEKVMKLSKYLSIFAALSLTSVMTLPSIALASATYVCGDSAPSCASGSGGNGDNGTNNGNNSGNAAGGTATANGGSNNGSNGGNGGNGNNNGNVSNSGNNTNGAGGAGGAGGNATGGNSANTINNAPSYSNTAPSANNSGQAQNTNVSVSTPLQLPSAIPAGCGTRPSLFAGITDQNNGNTGFGKGNAFGLGVGAAIPIGREPVSCRPPVNNYYTTLNVPSAVAAAPTAAVARTAAPVKNVASASPACVPMDYDIAVYYAHDLRLAKHTYDTTRIERDVRVLEKGCFRKLVINSIATDPRSK